jgi:coenzyme PQQ precursor peptide PqqA
VLDKVFGRLIGVAGRSSRLTGGFANRSLASVNFHWREAAMKWKTPVIIEIAVGLEINAYACAEV